MLVAILFSSFPSSFISLLPSSFLGVLVFFPFIPFFLFLFSSSISLRYSFRFLLLPELANYQKLEWQHILLQTYTKPLNLTRWLAGWLAFPGLCKDCWELAYCRRYLDINSMALKLHVCFWTLKKSREMCSEGAANNPGSCDYSSYIRRALASITTKRRKNSFKVTMEEQQQ